MSLLITSNTPKNQVNTNTVGINLPYSYTNHLQGTLKIPPKSQIAVQSVKVNKSGNIQLNKYNTQFGFYVGRNTADDNWDDVFDKPSNVSTVSPYSPLQDIENNSLMVPTYILPKDEAKKNFSYNTEFVAKELEKAWIKSIYHPNLLENNNTGQGGGVGPKVVALRNASNQGFSGWDFRLHNASSEPAGALPTDNISGTWINSYYGNTPASYVAPTIQNPDSTDYQEYIGTDYPLSLVNGSFNCSFGTHRTTSGKGFAYSEFAIGLTRACLPTDTNAQDLPLWYDTIPYNGPTMPDAGSEGMGFSTDVNTIGTPYWDWCMASVKTGVGQHTVKLYQNVCMTSNAYNKTKTNLVEYDYRHVNSGNYYVLETTESTHVIFNIQNERVYIALQKGVVAPVVLVDGEDTGGTLGVANASNMKPVCPTTRFLYPKLLIKPLKTMYIDNYYGVDVKNHTYGTANHIDLWSQRNQPGMGALKDRLLFLDRNLFYSMKDADNIFNFKIMNSQYGLEENPSAGQERLNDIFKIVSAPSVNYDMSNSLNTLNLLGFRGNTDTSPEVLYATAHPNIVKWTSNQIPNLVSNESIFVRLKNMTFESANFSKSALSKILYHIPTFSNSGNTVGALHLEPNEMVYLDLNNPNEINLSTIEVDLVYNDETLATGIEGKTVVVFHIRRSRR
jgi:hypothetical protein